MIRRIRNRDITIQPTDGEENVYDGEENTYHAVPRVSVWLGIYFFDRKGLDARNKGVNT